MINILIIKILFSIYRDYLSYSYMT